MGLGLLAVLAALLFLPLWRVTPRGIDPVVRLSGLEWMESEVLGRSAQREWALGNIEQASNAFEHAIHANPGQPQWMRQYLQSLLTQPDSNARLLKNLPTFDWLLRLAGRATNDISLVAEAVQRVQPPSAVVDFLAPHERHLTTQARAIYLAALFADKRYEAFNRVWERAPAVDGDVSGMEEKLYRIAVEAIQSTNTTASLEARQKLAAQVSATPSGRIAGRLSFQVALHHADLASCSVLLELLASLRLDKMPDYVAYWDLLISQGNKAGALEAAANLKRKPETQSEVLELAHFWIRVGRPSTALALINDFATRADPGRDLWLLKAAILIANHDWVLVRNLAGNLKSSARAFDGLSAFTAYLEGLAAHAAGDAQAAQSSFSAMVADPDIYLVFSPDMLNELRRRNYTNEVARLETRMLVSAESAGGPVLASPGHAGGGAKLEDRGAGSEDPGQSVFVQAAILGAIGLVGVVILAQLRGQPAGGSAESAMDGVIPGFQHNLPPGEQRDLAPVVQILPSLPPELPPAEDPEVQAFTARLIPGAQANPEVTASSLFKAKRRAARRPGRRAFNESEVPVIDGFVSRGPGSSRSSSST